ncbi:MAG: succinate dehydrogenase, cytochrome b556 subunit [Acetobacteraceae bacterium]|nr:succinate dehydrogenase, cytochrome b556 subunit [Acetobacteraceae bacterium]
MADVRDALMVGRTSDGKLVRRPLSPHLQIYKPQIVTVTSVVHRATGMALAAGTVLMVWWLAAAAASDAAYATATWFIGSWIGMLMLVGWTAALWYHFCNGIRHLAWDFGYGFELPTAHASGWAVVAGTVVLTVLTWILVFVAR